MSSQEYSNPFLADVFFSLGKRTGRPIQSSDSNDDSKEDEDEPTVSLQPFKGAKPTGSEVLSDSESDDSSDFIVEDDSQAVVAELPTEFSRRSHDDLSHQFKIIFQFFVHIAVRPSPLRRAFMENEIQRVILQ